MDRRRFLTRSTSALGAGAVGAALAPYAAVRAEFAAQLAVPPRQHRADYLLADGLTYFNHGSIGTIPRAVHQAHVGYLETCETNPWLHMWGGAWEAARETTRARAATFLGCRPSEIVINRNTTDGFNLLAAGLRLERGDEVLFSNLNHAGASVCWEHFAAQRGFKVRHFEIPLGAVPEMTAAELTRRHVAAIRPQTKVLVLPHMDNTLGVRTPVAAIAKAARAAGVGFVFADGAQVVGMLPVDVAALGVDAYCMSPHKWLQGPKGLGLMYMTAATQKQVEPQTVSWGQQRWSGSVRTFEDYGTRDVPAVLALGDAIAFHAAAGIDKTAARRKQLWAKVRERVAQSKRAVWRSPNDWELGGSFYAIEVKDVACDQLGARLFKEHKIVTRAFPGKTLNTLRLSLNTLNTPAEIDAFFAIIDKA